jgi:hypothetical protein
VAPKTDRFERFTKSSLRLCRRPFDFKPALGWVSIIATHGAKQPRRFAPAVLALAIYHREPKRRARLTKSLPQGLQSAGSYKGREAPRP